MDERVAQCLHPYSWLFRTIVLCHVAIHKHLCLPVPPSFHHYPKGYHGLADEVFLSLPCVLGDYGVCDVIKQPLAPEEVKLLQAGSAEIKAALAAIKL